MKHYFVSIDKLKEELETCESIDERIKKLSSEILNCRNELANRKNNLNELYLAQIIFNNADNEMADSINNLLKDNPINLLLANSIFSLLCNKLLEPFNYFLEQAVSILDYYKTIRDLGIISVDGSYGISTNTKHGDVQSRIVWKTGVSKLLKTFLALNKNGFLATCSKDEILAHFVIEGREQVSVSNDKSGCFQWLKSDCSFSIFIDELSKRNCVINRRKYRLFCSHFVNRRGERFQYLAQKKNYTDNVVHKGSGKIIRNILDSTGMHAILLLFYALLENIDFMMCIFLD